MHRQRCRKDLAPDKFWNEECRAEQPLRLRLGAAVMQNANTVTVNGTLLCNGKSGRVVEFVDAAVS